MFNDRYGLTAAVLQGRKTMTRRICKEYATGQPILASDVESFRFYPEENIVEFLMKDGTTKVSVPPYKDNEIVAVAQSYKDVINTGYDLIEKRNLREKLENELGLITLEYAKGWNNKLFVKPSLMPHQIQITDINIERLQDITDEDCTKEGILTMFTGYCYEYEDKHGFGYRGFSHVKDAFASLIDAVSGKGTWERNPFVFAYSFKLIK